MEGVASELLTHVNGADLGQVIDFLVEDFELVLIHLKGLNDTYAANKTYIHLLGACVGQILCVRIIARTKVLRDYLALNSHLF